MELWSRYRGYCYPGNCLPGPWLQRANAGLGSALHGEVMGSSLDLSPTGSGVGTQETPLAHGLCVSHVQSALNIHKSLVRSGV